MLDCEICGTETNVGTKCCNGDDCCCGGQEYSDATPVCGECHEYLAYLDTHGYCVVPIIGDDKITIEDVEV